MDRSLDEIVAERQRSNNRPRGRNGPPPPRRGGSNYPRDGVRKPARDERANLDNDWVHDRYDDEPSVPRGGGYSRPRGRRDDHYERDNRHDDRNGGRDSGRDAGRDREPPVSKIRVDNLHYDLTEDDLYELFNRIGRVSEIKLRYDRAGRSEGIAFVSYERVDHASKAIREFDGANAKGQPIRLTLIPAPRRDNPFDRAENPRSLFDRIENPRARRRSESPASSDQGRGNRRGDRRGGDDPRRSDTTKPAPENIDRYIPGQNGGRSDSRRGGRRPGERRERQPRTEDTGHKMIGGRPRKTQEELDAEMDDYWSGNATNGQDTETGGNKPATAAPQTNAAPAGDEIDMMIE